MSADPFDDPFAEPPPPAAPAAAPASASPFGFGGPPVIGAEARREQRVKVSWPGRVQLPGGQVVNLRVRDVSESGVGLVSEVPLPMQAVLTFAMGSPGLEDPAQIVALTGTLRVVYAVLQRGDYQVGCVIQTISDAHRDVLGRWVRRMRRV